MANGVHPHTAYRWFREGTLPVPAERVGPRTILVNIEANSSPSVTGGVGLYVRVSSHDQKADLERQTARLSVWAAKAGHRVVRIESEVASGMNGSRTKACRLLADSDVTTVVVERKDRLGRMLVRQAKAGWVQVASSVVAARSRKSQTAGAAWWVLMLAASSRWAGAGAPLQGTDGGVAGAAQQHRNGGPTLAWCVSTPWRNR